MRLNELVISPADAVSVEINDCDGNASSCGDIEIGRELLHIRDEIEYLINILITPCNRQINSDQFRKNRLQA